MRRYRNLFPGSSAAKPTRYRSVRYDIAAWLSMLCSDHGAVRLIYNNLFYVGDGMYRCSQPSPGQLGRYQRRYGIRTVINLRGRNPYGSYRLEVAACRGLGITLHDTKVLKSRSPPDEAAIRELHELFSSIEYRH